MHPATAHAADDEVTTELPVTAPVTPTDTTRRTESRTRRPGTPRDIYLRRRETAAAALLVAGGTLIWSQIGESVLTFLGR